MAELASEVKDGSAGSFSIANAHLLVSRQDELVSCIHPDCEIHPRRKGSRLIERKYACGDIWSQEDEICLLCQACVSMRQGDRLPKTHRIFRDRFVFCPGNKEVREFGKTSAACPVCTEISAALGRLEENSPASC